MCKKCHKKGVCQHTTTALSWDDKGVRAQAEELGEPYTKFYLGAYAMPNMHVHVSLTSALQEDVDKSVMGRKIQRRHEGDFALLNAHAVMLMVIRSQNDLFSLALENEIEACEKEWAEVSGPPSTA